MKGIPTPAEAKEHSSKVRNNRNTMETVKVQAQIESIINDINADLWSKGWAQVKYPEGLDRRLLVKELNKRLRPLGWCARDVARHYHSYIVVSPLVWHIVRVATIAAAIVGVTILVIIASLNN